MPITNDQLSETKDKFETMTSLLGLDVEIDVTEQEDRIHVNVKTEDAGRLIGRRGKTLSAIQLLLNGMLRKNNDDFPRILIDVEGDQEKNGGGEKREDRKPKERRNNSRGGNRNNNRNGERNERKNDKNGERNDNRRNRNNNKRNGRHKSRNNERDNSPIELTPRTEEEIDAISQADIDNAIQEEVDANAPIDLLSNIENDSPAEAAAAALAAEEAAPVEETPQAESVQPELIPEEPAAEPEPAPAEEPKSDQPAMSPMEQKLSDAIGEVKRWGEEMTLRGLNEEGRAYAIDYVKDDNEVVIVQEGSTNGNPNLKIKLK